MDTSESKFPLEICACSDTGWSEMSTATSYSHTASRYSFVLRLKRCRPGLRGGLAEVAVVMVASAVLGTAVVVLRGAALVAVAVEVSVVPELSLCVGLTSGFFSFLLALCARSCTR